MTKKFLKFLYSIGFFSFIFYSYAFLWLFFHKKLKETKELNSKEILQIFYFDFLKVPRKRCKIIKITKSKLITRCNNNCPILNLSKAISLDTRESCKKISEPVCKYFLKKLNKNIEFKRNYNYIRPYKKFCEETIIIKRH